MKVVPADTDQRGLNSQPTREPFHHESPRGRLMRENGCVPYLRAWWSERLRAVSRGCYPPRRSPREGFPAVPWGLGAFLVFTARPPLCPSCFPFWEGSVSPALVLGGLLRISACFVRWLS